MKKIHVIVQKSHLEASLERLAELGTVHIEHCQSPTGHRVDEANETVEVLDQVIGILETCTERPAQKKCEDWIKTATEILDLQSLITQNADFIEKRKALITKWEEWGNFDPVEIEKLRDKGMFVELYEIPASTKNLILPDNHVFQEVSNSRGMRRFISISDKAEDLPFTKVSLPTNSLNNLKMLQEHDEMKVKAAKELLNENAAYLECLKQIRENSQYDLTFSQTAAGMTDYDDVCFLKGFIPDDQVFDLKDYSKQNHWGLLIEDPSDEDEVPTLMRNPKWVELSKPALGVIEILPGYKEVDVSAVFLIFFTLFFAILIGDAGYGAIFLLFTFIAQKKLGHKLKDQTAFSLLYLLNGFTVFWGILTGTYFGQQWLPESINPVVPWLNDMDNLQWLCFTIALVHLNIAHIWTAIRKMPSITVLSEVGWLMVIWGMYFLANMFVLGKAVPSFTGPLIIGGAVVALLFMFPSFKELKKNIGQESIPHVLSVIGAGTDIISYIRLFAVGLAAVAVADAANAMPAEMGFTGYIFMFVLHVLNLILSAMAILVHAIRLNVLEFSGHLGLEWVGSKYNPFKKKLKEATI